MLQEDSGRDQPPAPPALEMVVFEIDDQRCALPASAVHELIRVVRPTPLPGAPEIVEGIFNFRGEVIPVLNLRKRLRIKPKALAPSDHLVIASSGARRVAIRSDRATDLIRVEADELDSMSTIVPEQDFIAAVVRHASGMILLCDLDRLLSPGEHARLEGAMRAGAAEGE